MSTLVEMHGLCLKVAPELAARPLYLFDRPEGHPTAPHTLAFHQITSPLLKAHLESEGKWAGPGSAIVYCRQNLPRAPLVALTLHEASHAVLSADDIAPDFATTQAAVEADRACFTEWSEKSTRADIPAWFPNHNAKFLRVLVHLWWRSVLVGEYCPIHLVFAGAHDYGLSSIGLYQNALACEPVQMLDKPFREILAIAPPREFSDLWRSDFQFWIDANPDTVEVINKKETEHDRDASAA